MCEDSSDLFSALKFVPYANHPQKRTATFQKTINFLKVNFPIIVYSLIIIFGVFLTLLTYFIYLLNTSIGILIGILVLYGINILLIMRVKTKYEQRLSYIAYTSIFGIITIYSSIIAGVFVSSNLQYLQSVVPIDKFFTYTAQIDSGLILIASIITFAAFSFFGRNHKLKIILNNSYFMWMVLLVISLSLISLEIIANIPNIDLVLLLTNAAIFVTYLSFGEILNIVKSQNARHRLTRKNTRLNPKRK